MIRTPDREPPASLDAALSAVANDQRRAVLRVLDRSDGKTMEFSALVDRVAERVRAAGSSPSPDGHRRRVRTALVHSHLPKLDACGMIEYDTEAMQVRNGSSDLGQDLLTVVEPYETRQ